MLRRISMVLLLAFLSVASAGCCCVQGMPGGACGAGSCGVGGCGPCGGGPLLALAGCRGACDGVYVDEWVSEPPVVDDCGYDCGGCSRCRQPVRNLLRLLWGTPYNTCCDTGMCGPSCGDGCGCDSQVDSEYYVEDSFGAPLHSGYAPNHSSGSCNCGNSHSATEESVVPVPTQPGVVMPHDSAPSVVPQTIPTPAPTVTPTSATRRLNPAAARRR